MPDYDKSVSENFVAITPSNSTTLSIRGFHVGVGGDVVAVDATGDQVTFKCSSGAFYPYAVRKIMAATTATSIVGLV